jgi:predicted nucleotidyltransferase
LKIERAVIFPKKEVLYGKSREEFKLELLDKLKGRVQEAWLFGSITGDDFDPLRSDVDLIIITETDLPFIERWKKFKDIIQLSEKMDLLVYTPDEWGNLTIDTAGFWGSVNRQKVRLL